MFHMPHLRSWLPVMVRQKVSSRMLSLASVFALAMMLCGTQIVSAAPLHAKTTTSSKCIIHIVHLNGSSPATIKCNRWVGANYIVSPATSEQYCNGVPGIKLGINGYYSGSWCFTGSGYLGLGSTQSSDIYTVNQVFSYNCGNGWVMYYNNPPSFAPPGKQFNVACYGTYVASNSPFIGNPGSDMSPKVTQVYLN